jgi:Xaa-Pro aminopeptidase
MDAFIRNRQQKAMTTAGLDALVAFSRENVAYGAGYVVPSQQLNVRNRSFAVAVNADGRAAMLLTKNEMQEARDRALIEDLHPYDEFHESPMAVLAGVIEALGAASGRVGVEMNAITGEQWEALRAALPNARFVDGAPVLLDARRVKSGRELEMIRKITAVAHASQARAHRRMHAGVSEQEVARWIIDEALGGGADTILMVQVAGGERSTFSNPTPTARVLGTGEVVKIDVLVSLNGYLSDTGRCVWVERASPENRSTWAKVADTMDEVEALVRPGASTRQLWEAFTKGFTTRGLPADVNFLGHGLGLSVHEEPFIAAHAETVLEPGMVLAIEPAFESPGGLYWLEDNLLVTESGYESLTTALPHGMIVTPTVES